MSDRLATPTRDARDRAVELTSAPPAPSTPVAEATLAFDRVSKWYGPVLGLNQVSLELRPGITGLVGHNGAGKSTLLNLAAGLVRPELGSVRVHGLDTWTAEAKRLVGFVPELDVFFEDQTARRFLETIARLSGTQRREARTQVAAALETVGLADAADRALAGFSKGMRQRTKLAQAMLHDPPLLLLDEPLNGIDPVGRREMITLFRQLAERGKCLLVSSHELDALDRLTDQVAVLTGGRLAAVGPVTRIREVLDDHPHRYRLTSDRDAFLAQRLLECDLVTGLDRDAEGLTVRVRHPRRFCEQVSTLVREEALELTCLQSLDGSTEDVLGYLLRGTPVSR